MSIIDGITVLHGGVNVKKHFWKKKNLQKRKMLSNFALDKKK